jgi:hypothetical protein
MKIVTEVYKTSNVQGAQLVSMFSKGPTCFMKSAHDYFIQMNLPLHPILSHQRPVNTRKRYFFTLHLSIIRLFTHITIQVDSPI